MPQIRPITDLRNANEISELCHARKEPVFITKNGYGDLVVLSIEAYEELMEVLFALSKEALKMMSMPNLALRRTSSFATVLSNSADSMTQGPAIKIGAFSAIMLMTAYG